jgi:hypothetical protein
VGRAVRVLVKRPEADEVVVAEELNLLAGLLHLDVLGRERVNAEDLNVGAWVSGGKDGERMQGWSRSAP